MLDPILKLTMLLAFAQPGEDWDDSNVGEQQQEEFVPEEEDYSSPADEDIPAPAQRAAEADANFETIMQKNAVMPKMPAPAAQAPAFDFDQRNLVPPLQPVETKVVVPLRAYGSLRDQLKKEREGSSRAAGPAIVLGASDYRGEARSGALALTLNLDVTLGAPNRWKTVPLVGDDVVLVSARRGNEVVPVSRENGYHVWVTKDVGEVRLTMELLVPARGPRGSIEFDFLSARTPITRFECRFPVAGLEPRIDAAVQSEVRSDRESTTMIATLHPTTRIHLVGFRDLGETDAARAKLYSESLNLLSIDEGTLEIFSVIRYTILYGGTKDFQVLLPPGMTVLSADGEGAFRYTVEKTDRGSVLRGETAFPIRNAYEISLRLKRELSKIGKEERFDVPLPRCIGVEREHGWLGVEVPGKLKLEEEKREQVLPVDVRQLPPEMVQSAVSPILKAYRYHSQDAAIGLSIARLPEKDPASASVDKIRAFTVVAPEGKVLTDLKITLRNRLRHTLVLSVPHGTEVLSTLLDGQPVKPSKNERGQLMLPLRRSKGDERLEPFTLQVVLESDQVEMGLFGSRGLSLPAVDLPVSSLAWSVYLPAYNTYSALSGELAAQTFAGEGSWHQPAYRAPIAGGPQNEPIFAAGEESESADTGAMPVRIDLPESGIRLEHSRYWVDADEPVRVGYSYLRSWLITPIWLFLALIVAGLIVLAGEVVRKNNALVAGGWIAIALALFVCWPLARLGGTFTVILALFAGLVVVLARRGTLGGMFAATGDWWRTLPARWRERDKGAPLSVGTIAWKCLIGAWMIGFSLLAFIAVVRFLFLLTHPLAG